MRMLNEIFFIKKAQKKAKKKRFNVNGMTIQRLQMYQAIRIARHNCETKARTLSQHVSWIPEVDCDVSASRTVADYIIYGHYWCEADDYCNQGL